MNWFGYAVLAMLFSSGLTLIWVFVSMYLIPDPKLIAGTAPPPNPLAWLQYAGCVLCVIGAILVGIATSAGQN